MPIGHQTVDKSPKYFAHRDIQFGYYLEFGYCDLGFQICDGYSKLLQSRPVILNFDVSLKRPAMAVDFSSFRWICL